MPPLTTMGSHRAAGSRWIWLCLALGTATSAGVATVYRTAATSGRGHARALHADLIAAAATTRVAEARLTGLSAWNDVPAVRRGSAGPVTPAIQIAALQLREAAETGDDVDALRGVGCAHLVLGEVSEAIAALEEAALIAPDAAAVRVDLSAALYERWRQSGQPLDLVRVVEESSVALARDPRSADAAFNRALALSALKLRAAAGRAWQRFLELDRSPAWAVEARHRMDAVAVRDATWTAPAADAPDAAIDTLLVTKGAGPAYRHIENALNDWAKAALVGTSSPIDVAERLANALKRTGKDAYLAALLHDVRASAQWPAVRRQSLAQGVTRTLEWRSSIDAGDYARAEKVAAEARHFLLASGFDTIEADFEVGYSDFVVPERETRALGLLEQVDARARQAGFWRIAAKATRLRALKAATDTRIAEAQERYESGLLLADRADDPELTALFDTFLGETYGQQGELRMAWQHLARALGRLDDLNLVRRRFDVLSACSNAARRSGLDHTSLFLADELLRELADWPNPEGRIAGHLGRARSMADLDLGDRGERDLDEAAALVEQMGARPAAQARLRREVAAARAFSLFGRNDRAALAAASTAIEFFGTSVQIRLAELRLQRGRIHERLGDVPAAMADWEQGVDVLEDQRPALQNELLRIARTAAFWDLFGELIEHQRPDPLVSLATAERARARELVYSLAPDQSPERVSIASVQKILAGGMQAVVYTQLPDRLLVWVVDSNRVTLTERRVSALRMRQIARRFLRSLEADEPDGAGDELARLVLPPGIVYRSDRPLVFVPDQALHAIPFAALPVPGRDQRLVQAVIPVVAPSLAAFGLASERAVADPAPSVLAVGVGTGVESEGLPRLPNADREASKVFDLYGRRGRLLIDNDASRDAIAAALASARVVHFAGHAVFDPLFPSRSRLLVAGGAMTMPDLAAAGIRPGTIAVLSACETAVGQTFRGEGPISLVRTFLAAGASATIATLWKVKDDEAAGIMPVVHGFLARGLSAPESLAGAQRQLIDARAPAASWAGFVAYGGAPLHRKD